MGDGVDRSEEQSEDRALEGHVGGHQGDLGIEEHHKEAKRCTRSVLISSSAEWVSSQKTVLELVLCERAMSSFGAD